ncbi:hypothetical protein GT037_009472 [Alternaria burnsii]|uniref:Peptidase metallopeptidase domain-containing protein n=1 Tax=Alternaria burnsii TaxID=1187904 RepID=A0A8H7AW69_9PLEO|nr:uncharacterized protein GT037_009472 [Alternaria burnsii]KAF7672441.1 hypothetical protein GT037_009472 [Alternaria burnsii]
MYLSPTFVSGLLLASAEGVLGGSRFWEAKAPNQRTNSTPDYLGFETYNSTSSLMKRAFSMESRPNDKLAPRLWPNKKIRYHFEDPENLRLKGIWERAIELWAPLKAHGFSYEEVPSKDEWQSNRDTVLLIKYNTDGKLSSTLGIPPINEAANDGKPTDADLGPVTNLSDNEGIGQDDIHANIAHELGHVWGLIHEHQNPRYWRITSGDYNNGWSLWSGKSSQPKFKPSDFDCEALSDFAAISKTLNTLVAEAREANDHNLMDKLQFDLDHICVSMKVAGKWGFSAAEWLPYPSLDKKVSDDNFDPNSIMMYPSRAGGIGLGDDREVVLKYDDGSLIPNRLAPSPMDINRLITLYGKPALSVPGEPHNSRSSQFFNRLKKIRSGISRAGDTKGGSCDG